MHCCYNSSLERAVRAGLSVPVYDKMLSTAAGMYCTMGLRNICSVKMSVHQFYSAFSFDLLEKRFFFLPSILKERKYVRNNHENRCFISYIVSCKYQSKWNEWNYSLFSDSFIILNHFYLLKSHLPYWYTIFIAATEIIFSRNRLKKKLPTY